MKYSAQNTVGEIVAADYRTAAVFDRHSIDYCCNGNKNLATACEEKSMDVNKLLTELENSLVNSSESTTDFKSWPLDLLADYIEKKHHKYCESRITEIKPYIEKINSVHGSQHPELSEVKQLFDKTAAEMSMHMKREELTLFPYIRKLVNAKEKGVKVDKPRFGSAESPIARMMDDHAEEGERFRKIRELTNDYTTPADGCNTYKITLEMLKEFEEDLHLHIHLENNILFPKSLEIEKEVGEFS